MRPGRQVVEEAFDCGVVLGCVYFGWGGLVGFDLDVGRVLCNETEQWASRIW